MTVRPEIRKLWEESLLEHPEGEVAGALGEVLPEYSISEMIGGSLVKPPEQQVGGESIIGKIFDVLSRGEYASANLAKDYILSRPFDIKSAVKGIKGEEKFTYDDLSEAVFSDWSPWKRKAMGFALAIFADPTTYTPAGVLTVPFKAMKRVPGVAKGLKAIKKTPIGEAFIPGAKVPKKYYEAKYYAKKALEAEEQRIFRQVEKLRKGLTKEDMTKLSYFRQHPDELHKLSPKLKSKLEKIGDIFDNFVTKAEADGIITPEIASKWRGRDVPYLPGYYPARGIRLVKGDMPSNMFEKVRMPTYMKKKKFETLEDAKLLSGKFEKIANAKTMEEANKLIKGFELEDAFGKVASLKINDVRDYSKKLSEHYKPEENVVKLTAYRGIEQVRFTARTKFVDDTLATFGTKIKSGTKVVPEGHGIYMPKGAIRFYAKETVDADVIAKMVEKHGDMIPVDELTDFIKKYPSITKKVPTYTLPKEIADDLNYAAKIMGGDPATKKMFQLFDKTQNMWKGFATAVRLPFHLRNMYSNWWQAALSGVQNPRRFVQAAEVQASYITKANKKIQLGDKVYTYKELRTLANEMGVRGKGWLGADIDVRMFDEIESMINYGKFRNLSPMKLGRKFGTAIEDNSRFAVFIDQLAKGKSPKDASRTVRKYLFDYDELTDFERKVMKRVIPFYTWTRKNAPLQIESLVTQPRKYQAYVKALRAFDEEETIEERMAKPEYFNKMLYVKSPFKSKSGKPLHMSIDLPPLELNRVFDTHQLLSSATPFKVIPEIIFNFKTFPKPGKLGKPLELSRAPFWVGWLPKFIFKAMTKKGLIDKRMNTNTGEYELGINKKLLHVIHTALPFLNEQSRIHAAPISLEDETPANKLKSYLSGIGFKTMDIPLEMGRRAREVDARSLNLESFMQQRGRLPTIQELEQLK